MKVGSYYWVVYTIMGKRNIYLCRMTEATSFGSAAILQVLKGGENKDTPLESNSLGMPIFFDQIPNSAPATDSHLLAHRLKGGQL